jgi:hypothetical protein
LNIYYLFAILGILLIAGILISALSGGEINISHAIMVIGVIVVIAVGSFIIAYLKSYCGLIL